MEFEWLISRLREVMEIFKNVESHGKDMENRNIPQKNDILAKRKMWYSR